MLAGATQTPMDSGNRSSALPPASMRAAAGSLVRPGADADVAAHTT